MFFFLKFLRVVVLVLVGVGGWGDSQQHLHQLLPIVNSTIIQRDQIGHFKSFVSLNIC